MAYTFDNAKAPSTRRTQYFEMFGHRAIYHDGWVACTTPPYGGTWEDQTKFERVDVISGYKWELYQRRRGLQRGRQPCGQVSRQASRTPAAVLCRGGQVQRAAAGRQRHGADGPGHPPQPHARTHRVHLLRDRDAHPRGRGAGRQEQVVPHHRRRGPLRRAMNRASS